MSRRRPLIVAGSVVVAIVAGIWAGDAASPAPQRRADAPALAHFDAARDQARAGLSAATTPEDQGSAARDLAAVYRHAAPTLPDQQAPLHDAAGAYDALAAASATTEYATAARRALEADSALAVALRRPPGDPAEPLIPPVLPLVLLVAAATGAAVSSRRRKATPPRPGPQLHIPPRPPDADPPHWDTPPPELYLG
jgi:hypothetical protein